MRKERIKDLNSLINSKVRFDNEGIFYHTLRKRKIYNIKVGSSLILSYQAAMEKYWDKGWDLADCLLAKA